jgi:hypothetical protein
MPGHRVSERPQARSWRPAPRDHHRMVRLFVNASAAALVFGPLFFAASDATESRLLR